MQLDHINDHENYFDIEYLIFLETSDILVYYFIHSTVNKQTNKNKVKTI